MPLMPMFNFGLVFKLLIFYVNQFCVKGTLIQGCLILPTKVFCLSNTISLKNKYLYSDIF